VSSDTRDVTKPQKNKYGKPIREFIIDIYNKLAETDELTRDELRQMLYNEIKLTRNEDVNKDTINAQIIQATVNDASRRHFGVNEINMDVNNFFYYIDENNKKGGMKKYIPSNPPKNIKIYFRKKDTKEDSEIVL